MIVNTEIIDFELRKKGKNIGEKKVKLCEFTEKKNL